MSMWKRLAAGALAVGLVSTALAGCAKQETQKENTGDGTAPAKVTEIVFWEQEDNVEKTFDPLIAKFMETNKNIKVTRVHYTTEDLRTNFLQAVQGNQGPHVIYGPDDNIGVFATAGVVQPLDSFFSADFLGTLNPTALEGNKFNGKLWGIPDRIGNHLTLVYNKALVAKPPADTDELFKFAEDFSKKNPGKYALVFNQEEPFWAAPWLGGFGGKVFNDKNEPTLDTPAMVGTLKLVQDFKAKGVMPKESNYDTADAMFKEGKAAMIINGPWSWSGYQEAKIEIGLARIPKVAGKDWPKPYTATKTYSVSKIVTDKDTQAAAKAFIEFMNSEETQKTLAALHKQQPTNKKAAASDVITKDPIMQQSSVQLEVGTPMPIIPEMRHVWDSWKPQWQLVLAGNAKPEDAAKAAQADAVKRIKESK